MSATVGQLFHSLDRDKVIAAIKRLYPEQPGDWPEGYERAWQQIVAKEVAAPSAMVCELYQSMSMDDPPEPYISVHGIEDGQSYAIEYVPWAEWLSMPVRLAREVGAVSEIDTLAHIFWEMTWVGYDDETISAKLTDLADMVDEIKASAEQPTQEAQSK